MIRPIIAPRAMMTQGLAHAAFDGRHQIGRFHPGHQRHQNAHQHQGHEGLELVLEHQEQQQRDAHPRGNQQD
jgi:hypothetical protein